MTEMEKKISDARVIVRTMTMTELVETLHSKHFGWLQFVAADEILYRINIRFVQR